MLTVMVNGSFDTVYIGRLKPPVMDTIDSVFFDLLLVARLNTYLGSPEVSITFVLTQF